MTEPIVLEFDVACGPARAFELWTAQIGRWWPADHTVSGDAAAEVVLEPGIGGRIYERAPGGAEHLWGTITRWQPGQVLAYRWHIGGDPSEATDVEIRFDQISGSTRVRIEHRGWDRFGAEADARRKANRAGWGGLIPHFVAVAKAEDDDRS